MCEIWFPGSAPECRGGSASGGRRRGQYDRSVSALLAYQTRPTGPCCRTWQLIAATKHFTIITVTTRPFAGTCPARESEAREGGWGVGVFLFFLFLFFLLIKLVSLCRAPARFIIAVWDWRESLRARPRPCVSSSVGVSSVHNKVAVPNSLLGLPRGTRFLSRDLFTAQF